MRASWIGRLVAACVCLAPASASAFVATPVGGHPKELDVHLRYLTERGKLEPNENQASWLKEAAIDEYTLGVGYTWGHFGPLQFFSTRLEATYYRSAEEVNDLDKWVVGAPGSADPTDGIVDSECTNGAEYLGNGRCRFYPEDTGTIATATVSFAALHNPSVSLGFYLKGSVPFSMDLEKFSNPRIDHIAFGYQLGVHMTPWLDYESILFFGTGTRPFGEEQNSAIAVNNLFHFHARRWLLPWKAGFKIGPYIEGDFHERFDARYDAAYSPQRLPQPGSDPNDPSQHRDRIRAARFAVAMLPYFLVTDHLSVELGYIQKFFGYDARATQAYFVGLRGLIDLGD